MQPYYREPAEISVPYTRPAGPTREEKIRSDARALVSAGLKSGLLLGAVLGGWAFSYLLIEFAAREAWARILAYVLMRVAMVVGIVVVFRFIQLLQGLVMLTTGCRIDFALKEPMTPGEHALTGAFVLGWIALVVGIVLIACYAF